MRHFLSNEERIKSRAEGEAEGILIGIAISVSNLMLTMNISQDDAINLLRVPEEDIPAVLEQLRSLS